jgi:Protein of unknown function (DUF2811)
MNPTVGILAEIPEVLHAALKGYLETHETWDQDQLFTAALTQFLLQNGEGDRRAVESCGDPEFDSTPSPGSDF